MSKFNVMVDLETLGTDSNAALLAIGAVVFDNDTVHVDTSFYSVIDPQSCVDYGLKIDVSTVMWWMKQSDEARAAITRKGNQLPGVLLGFSKWLREAGEEPSVWGNGATFDNVLLSNAYKAAGQSVPWKYYNDRCYRTMRAMLPAVNVEEYGTAHNALHDAIYQAKYLIAAAKAANISL